MLPGVRLIIAAVFTTVMFVTAGFALVATLHVAKTSARRPLPAGPVIEAPIADTGERSPAHAPNATPRAAGVAPEVEAAVPLPAAVKLPATAPLADRVEERIVIAATSAPIAPNRWAGKALTGDAAIGTNAETDKAVIASVPTRAAGPAGPTDPMSARAPGETPPASVPRPASRAPIAATPGRASGEKSVPPRAKRRPPAAKRKPARRVAKPPEAHVKKADVRQAAKPQPATKPKPRQEAQMKVLPHAPRVKAAVHARVRRARHASAPDRQQPENFAGPPNHLSSP